VSYDTIHLKIRYWNKA